MIVPAASLDALCTIQSGGTPRRDNPAFWGGDVPWVTITDMRGGVIDDTEECITEAGLSGSAAKLLPRGTLLLSIFATIGRTAVLNIEAATNQAIAGLTIKDQDLLDSNYLRRYLDFVAPLLASRGRGVAQANINLSILRSTNVPLPPLAKQHRIATILDKADALRAKRREAIAKLNQLLQSVFLDMFGDPVSNSMQWPEAQTLGDVADIVSGITKGRKARAATREVPYLAVSNVHDRVLKLDVVKRIEATDDEINRYSLRPNDLLLTEGGDPDKLGRGALWKGEISECVHQNHVFRVRLASDALHPVYMGWLVGSERGKRYFAKQAKQTTGIASINMRQLRGFPLLVPPIDLQLRFAEVVRQVEKQRQRIERHRDQLDTLFASLQHRAFTGTL